MLRNRLIDAIDDRINGAQYGFRAKKSTTQPLYVARRLIDIAEASGDTMILTLLDWEKAFDRIDQEELVKAVQRMHVPEETIDELRALYKEIHFCTSGCGRPVNEKSAKDWHKAGGAPFTLSLHHPHDCHDGRC